MSSNVEICNLALNHIGLKSIVSIDQDNAQARQMKAVFNLARDSALRAHTWNFATKIEPLALINGEVVPGWDYLYAYPSTCLFIRKLLTESTLLTASPEKWKEIRSPTTNVRALACNLDQAYAEFTMKIQDPSLFDQTFVTAFSFLLASMTAMSLTGDKALSNDMLVRYKEAVDIAKVTNASESNAPKPEYTSFYDVR